MMNSAELSMATQPWAGWYQGCVVLYLLRAVHHRQTATAGSLQDFMLAPKPLTGFISDLGDGMENTHRVCTGQQTGGGADMLRGRAAFKGEFNKLKDLDNRNFTKSMDKQVLNLGQRNPML